MGKVVKYCATCEESFSERFSFCPNCASGLTAYEMNPVGNEVSEPVNIFEPANEVVPEPIEEPTVAFDATSFEQEMEPEAPAFLSQPTDDVLEIEDEIEEVDESPVFPTVPAVAATSYEDYQQTYQTQQFSEVPSPAQTESYTYAPKPSLPKADDDGYYHVTFVQPKDGGTRNLLLLGATLLVFTVSFGWLIYSIMFADANVAALDDRFNDIVYVEEPVATEPEPPEPKMKDKDDGGGGGGGKEEEVETSKGRLAQQVEKPEIPPSARMNQVTNPEIPITPATQGNKTVPPSTEPYGNPNSKNFNIASDGTGSGGGQGAGQGTGQGNGRGTGQGNGIGSGSGNGNGNGNGDGSGRGSGNDDDGGPPPIKVGPTEGIKILSKPRPAYTDAARTNQVQGTVTLRVTFLANGAIGSISPVSGLPNGLTEQAIAAARNIKFEPAKKNGVPYAVTKQVQYNFTLY